MEVMDRTSVDTQAAMNVINSVNPQHRATLMARFGITDDTVPVDSGITDASGITDDDAGVGGMEQVEKAASEAFQSYCQLYHLLLVSIYIYTNTV